MVNSWTYKGLLIGVLGISQVACSDSNITTRLGDTNICIPNHFMVNLGSRSSSPDEFDEAPPIYESISIDPPYIQQDVPAYQGYGGDKTFPRYDALHVTITRYKPYQYEIPAADKNDHFFSKVNPSLVGNPYEWPFLNWSTFEIQSDQSRTYWGECYKYAGDPLDCSRSLEINGLDFTYSVTGTNVDLYPAIDNYLKQKVTEEWRCDKDI